ncbi:hypothetical protein ACO0LF_11190 [Undibacterium sp. Di27W]|uniref:hypothetical protein n=1 Tax=Undibacterium sp. Di27W TaxID=3413036 RepID=UPI003BF3F609
MIISNDPASSSGMASEVHDVFIPPHHPLTRRSDFKRQSKGNVSTGEYWDVNIGITTGATIGVVVGGVLGMVNASLAVIISPFFIPGFDFMVSSPLEAALVGAAFGVILGSVIGSLLAWGVSSQNTDQVETELDTNVSHLPVQEIEETQRVQTWKEQHGECANI